MAKARPPAQRPQQSSPQPHYATISLVMGILSILLPLFGVILGVLAIVYYVKQQRVGPSGMATAGLICGIVGIVINVIMVVAIAFALAFFFALVQPDVRLAGDSSIALEHCSINGQFSCGSVFAEGNNISLLLTSHASAANISMQATCPAGEAVQVPVRDLGSGEMARVTFECPRDVGNWDVPLELSYEQERERYVIYGFLRARSGHVGVE